MPDLSDRYALDERLRIIDTHDDGAALSLPDVLAKLNRPPLAVGELVGKSEAAAMFGKHPNNLARDVPELPAPEWTLKATPVWRRERVQAIVDARAAAATEVV